MIARQRIQAGLPHAGKTATVTCQTDTFRMVIDGETVAVVPATPPARSARYKARATHRRPPAARNQEGE
jgi:hypothetical protein